MSSSGNSNTSVDNKTSENDNNYPLWRYVTIMEKGGNVRWQCNYCNKIYFGSYSRVLAHLLKTKGQGIAVCNTVTPQHRFDMDKLHQEAASLQNSRSMNVPLPPLIGISGITMNVPMGSVFDTKKRKGGGSALEQAFNNEAREQLSCEIARMFYSSGLPFHMARNPHYINSYSFAANTPLSGYKPPGYNALRTTYLQKERANIESLLVPIKQTWNEKGSSIVSDGWGDPQRRPLINIMAITESGNMFLRAVNCEGEYKDKFHIAGLLKDAISEVGPYNVVQVVTDNAPVCKVAGMIIESQFPNIFWTPCVVHFLNLALKNICAPKKSESNQIAFLECNWITEVAADVVFVKKFICNHSMRLAMFNKFVNLKLLSVAETRFASTVVMLKRFKLIKRGLQELVISEEWDSYTEDDV